jgi:hypothetical protein
VANFEDDVVKNKRPEVPSAHLFRDKLTAEAARKGSIYAGFFFRLSTRPEVWIIYFLDMEALWSDFLCVSQILA